MQCRRGAAAGVEGGRLADIVEVEPAAIEQRVQALHAGHGLLVEGGGIAAPRAVAQKKRPRRRNAALPSLSSVDGENVAALTKVKSPSAATEPGASITTAAPGSRHSSSPAACASKAEAAALRSTNQCPLINCPLDSPCSAIAPSKATRACGHAPGRPRQSRLNSILPWASAPPATIEIRGPISVLA